MVSASSFLIIVSLMNIANAGGIGKAWEVSPVRTTDNPSSLSSRRHLETSAFEVRSVSGVGRLAPAFKETQKNKITEISSIPEQLEQTSRQSVPKLRVSKELDETEHVNVFVPAVELDDPTIDEFAGRSGDIDEVEALPSIWRKFRTNDRTGRNHGGHCSEVEEIDETTRDDDSLELSEKRPRVRREAETEMEKIAATKNIREARLDSSDSWSKQPISVEFRHRTKLEEAAEEEEKSARSTSRGIQAPHVDFVTSNRRSFTENRQSRDMPMTPTSDVRPYDEITNYRNPPRDRDLDASYTRGLFYPELYRTERDYFVRGSNEPSYQPDRYRDIDFDLYGRSRQLPKPKRIIYYATLPEIVRKPVDMRAYQRPYDPLTRSSKTAMSSDDYYKSRSGTKESTRYRYYAYPQANYANYDIYGKRASWKEPAYGSYAERMEDSRRREQDLDHASMKDNSRNEDSMLELGNDGKMAEREQEKLPWPVQIGTEVSVKENERITGRKIFGQRDDYSRFRNGGRVEREREQSASSDGRN